MIKDILIKLTDNYPNSKYSVQREITSQAETQIKTDLIGKLPKAECPTDEQIKEINSPDLNILESMKLGREIMYRLGRYKMLSQIKEIIQKA